MYLNSPSLCLRLLSSSCRRASRRHVRKGRKWGKMVGKAAWERKKAKPNNQLETGEARWRSWETRRRTKRGEGEGKGEKWKRESWTIWSDKYKPVRLNAMNILIFLQFRPSILSSFFVGLFSCRWLPALWRQPVLTLSQSQLDSSSLCVCECICSESPLQLLKTSLTFWVRQFNSQKKLWLL